MVVEEAAPEGYAVVKYLGKRYKVRLAKPTTAKSLLKAISKNYLRNTNPATLVLHTEFETTLGRDDLVHPGWTLRCTPAPPAPRADAGAPRPPSRLDRCKPCGDEAEGAKKDDGGDDDPLSSVPVYYARRRRFRRGEAGAAAHFQKLGYVVFAAALDGAEAATCLDKLWTFLEKVGPGLDRRDPSTWADAWPPGVGGAGILSMFGVGQCESKWFARTRPRVRECFAELWRAMAHPRADPRDLDAPGGLCVSLDGGCAWRPGLGGQKGWQHVDQNPLLKPGFECIQGLVSLTRTSKAAGGNLLVERSHADVFPKLVDLYPEQVRSRDGDDFFSLPRAAARRDGLLGGDGGGRHVVVHLEAGDLLCWDSRTVHCSWPGDGLLDEPGAPPAKADQLPTDRLARAALYVSFTPRSLVPPDVAAKRRQAVADGATTTHWASVCRRRDIVPKDMSDYERSRFRAQPTPPLSPEALMLI